MGAGSVKEGEAVIGEDKRLKRYMCAGCRVRANKERHPLIAEKLKKTCSWKT